MKKLLSEIETTVCYTGFVEKLDRVEVIVIPFPADYCKTALSEIKRMPLPKEYKATPIVMNGKARIIIHPR